MAKPALIPVADLRRCAKVAREEGVGVRVFRGSDGAFTVTFDPLGTRRAAGGDDLDVATEQFLRS